MTRFTNSSNSLAIPVMLILVTVCGVTDRARGVGYLAYGMGRNDYSNRYDVATHYWPTVDASGAAAGVIYKFGKFEVESLPPGINAAMALQGIHAAAAAWEPYVNIDIDTSGTIPMGSNTGLIRIQFDPAAALTRTGAYQWGGNLGQNFGMITFSPTSVGSPWNQTNFNWVLTHEFGHMLGIRDLYPDYTAPLAEDFVDHNVADVANPQREEPSLRDNIMFQYNYMGDNYSQNPQTIVDNDEIAGATWLWGGPQNQIVTGDMIYRGEFARPVVDVDFSHGDQMGNGLTRWDYRVSFKAGGDKNPYVDIEFPGYENFTASVLGATNPMVKHTALGNDIHRFEVQEAGWVGNVELTLDSEFSDERRVRAWVTGGGQTDNFVLPVNHEGLAHAGNNWAVVFGPRGPATDMDYGDLLDTYKTLLSSDGPRYDSHGLTLGVLWDTEIDGQPTPFADGDDKNLWANAGEDDEDGVSFAHESVTMRVNNTFEENASAHLDAWWDLNRNGMFEPVTEHIINMVLRGLILGETPVTVDNLGFNPTLYPSRFRLTYIDGTGVTEATEILPWGEYINLDGTRRGEVEDYFGYAPEPASLPILVIFALAGRYRRGRTDGGR